MKNAVKIVAAHVPSGRRARKLLVRAVTGLLAVCALVGCHAQWVAPYSADLQKKATDMSSDVVAWESHMRSVAGTAAADPRHPDVQAKFAAWRGDVEAMGEIELGVDPGSTACDSVIARIGGNIPGIPKPSGPASAGSESKSISHCESLPGIFARMTKQVTGSTADFAGIPFELEQPCKLPWLSDAYFVTLQEARATAGASTPARPALDGAKARTPTKAEQATAFERCRGLFDAPKGALHGVVVDSLMTDLSAIVYREGRQAPTATE
jgi:hypothetical protein